MSITAAKLKKLQKGQTVQLKHDEIADIANRFIVHDGNKKKLMRAYNKGTGIRINLNPDELEDNMGAGLMSMAKKGSKFVRENKQLNKLKDRAIEQGVNYAMDKAGADEDTKRLVGNISKKAVNYGLDATQGAGVMSMAKKGAKFVRENKQLNKLKDRAIEQGVNYAMDKAGADEDTKRLVGNISKKAVNYGLDSTQGAGFGNIVKKGLKYGKKGLKVGNTISNALGYDDLDNMAIDFAAQQTLGRIDPTLGNMAAKQLNRLADKELGSGFRTYGGSIDNPYIDDDNDNDKGRLSFRPVDNPRQPEFPIGMYTMPNPKIRNEILRNSKMKKPLIGAGFRMYE
jgi:predicted peroxiredoxin